MNYRSATFPATTSLSNFLNSAAKTRRLALFIGIGAVAVMASGCSSSGGDQPAAGNGGGGTSSAQPTGGAKFVASGGVGTSARGGSGGLSQGGASVSGGAGPTGGADSGAKGGAVSSGGANSVGGANAASGAPSGGNSFGGAGAGASSGGTSSAGGSGGHTASGGVGGTNSGGSSGNPGGGGASQTCPASQKPPTAGNQRVTLQHGGQSRSFILHVPRSLGAEPLPLVFDFHGASGSGSGQQNQSGWDAVADREHFLTVYPDGVGGYWNVDDTCCGVAGSQKVDDVGFVKAMITKLSTDICIDRKRIFASGFSNGGGLAHRLGCQAADVIAAIAPTATDLRTKPCEPVRPISMIEFRGLNDDLEPYAGGVVGPVGGQYISPGAKGSLKLWADIDKCQGNTVSRDSYCESYSSCADGVDVALCSLPNTSHDVYHNGPKFDVPGTAWKMFASHPMK